MSDTPSEDVTQGTGEPASTPRDGRFSFPPEGDVPAERDHDAIATELDEGTLDAEDPAAERRPQPQDPYGTSVTTASNPPQRHGG